MNRKVLLRGFGFLLAAAFLGWAAIIARHFFPEVIWTDQLAAAWEWSTAVGIVDLILLGGCLVLAGAAGSLLVQRLLPAADRDTTEHWLFATVLGLGVIAYTMLTLGGLRLYYPWPIRILTLAAAVLLRRRCWGLMRAIGRLVREARGPRLADWGATSVVGAFLLLLYLLVCAVAALAPETEFDALNHHLGIARLYVANHGVVRLPNFAWASHPMAVEMLYVFGWLISSPLLAKLFHFGMGVLVVLACMLFARRHLSSRVGVLAGLIFIASPMAAYLFHSAYVDLGLTLFTLAAVFSFCNWLQTAHRGWLVMAGLLTGLAMGAKYTGVTAAVLLTTAWTYAWFDRREWNKAGAEQRSHGGWRGFLHPLLVIGGLSLLVFSPWMVRNLLTVGNPTAPFLSDLIQTADLTAADYRTLARLTDSWLGYSGNLWDYLRAPWLMTLKGELFVGTPGPVFLIFVPVAVFLGWRIPVLRIVIVSAAAGFLFQLLGTRSVRYFVPLFALFALLIAGALFHRQGQRGGGAGGALSAVAGPLLLVFCFLQLPWFSNLWQGHRLLTLNPADLKLFHSSSEREAHLEERLLGTGGGALYRYLDEELPSNSRVLALTPVYQALTDRAVYLAPNSSRCTEASDSIIQASLAWGGLRTAELHLEAAGMHRFWKLTAADLDAYGPARGLRPRFFYRQGDGLLEIGLFGIVNTDSGLQVETTVDLGCARRVDVIEVWTSASQPPPVVRVGCSDGGQTSAWRDISITVRERLPRSVTAVDLATVLRTHGITQVIWADLQEVGFITRFLESAAARACLLAPRRFGAYSVYPVATAKGVTERRRVTNVARPLDD
jgi:hypothetical protein